MRKYARGFLPFILSYLVKIGDCACALRARLAFSDFYDSEKCVRVIFYAVRHPMGASAARPNFSSPLRSPMKNFQRSHFGYTPRNASGILLDRAAVAVKATSVICRETVASRGFLLPAGAPRPGGRYPQGHPAPKCYGTYKEPGSTESDAVFFRQSRPIRLRARRTPINCSIRPAGSLPHSARSDSCSR